MFKKITITFFILITFVIAYNLIKQISEALKSSERLTGMVEDIRKLEIKNKQLKQRIEAIKSPEFVEEQARNKLGLVKGGETIVIVSEEKIKQIMGASASAQAARLPNWLGWLKLFFKF